MPTIKAGTTQTLTADTSYSDVLQIDGELIFDPSKNITLTMNNKNIVVNGKFTRKPNPGITHRIIFAGIDESKFVGGGMEVLPTDIGLYVMGVGQIDWQGTPKTGWSSATAAIKSGNTVIGVKDATGWQQGDEIFITPTLPNVFTCEERKILSISGNIVTVDKPLGDHPAVVSQSGKILYAEVGNLTRNVRTEGTATGQSHIFIHSTAIQTIKHTAIRFMGPRKDQGGGTEKEFVIGRYGIHFHHCGHINGTAVEGNVIRDTGSHCYVPHGSHGIAFRDNIAYNVTETAYWYDLAHKSHNLLFEKNIAATVKYVPRSLNMDLKETDPDLPPTFASSGLLIGMGDGNIFRDNVACGTQGDPRTGGGFMWETNNEGVPIFENNLAHNCTGGLRVWQNTENNHVITGQIVYNCDIGVYHGAYANSYKYDLCEIINCPFIVHGASVNSSRIRIERSKLDALIFEGSPLPGKLPILVRDCDYKTLINQVGQLDEAGSHSVDVVRCTGINKVDPGANNSEVVRVQPKSGQATKMTNKGTTNIAAFAPTMWGTGTGLRGEYYNDATFSKKVLERIDSIIMFPEMDNFAHYLLTGKLVSMIWTGFIEPQFSETHTFLLASAGTPTLLIDGKKITGPLPMIAGKKYPIELKFFNNDQDLRGGMNFLWKCPSLDKFNPVPEGEYVPQSQLYPSGTVTPPVNKPPVANAGNDITVTLPTNSVTLNGSGSDSDGTIVKYLWGRDSGPANTFIIVSPNSAVTQATGLEEGSYVFLLQVVDNAGAAGMDYVTVTVKPKPSTNQPPNVSISISKTVLTDVVLKSTVTDSDSTVVSYQWSQVSGPTVTLSGANTGTLSFKGAPKGDYSFNLIIAYNNQAQTITPYNFSL